MDVVKKIDLSKISTAELEELLREKREEENRDQQAKRDAYEGIRAQTVYSIMSKVESITGDVQSLHDFVLSETSAFKEVMSEYGQLRNPHQLSFRIQEGDYRIEVKTNKVKKFDERADLAATRLIEFLQKWIERAPGGTDNPMYQLAMVLLERNKDGDLDYKNVSKLYDLEGKFADPEYGEIMMLFKESHLVEGTATNYYFWKRDKQGVWRKIEPSFNRL